MTECWRKRRPIRTKMSQAAVSYAKDLFRDLTQVVNSRKVR